MRKGCLCKQLLWGSPKSPRRGCEMKTMAACNMGNTNTHPFPFGAHLCAPKGCIWCFRLLQNPHFVE